MGTNRDTKGFDFDELTACRCRPMKRAAGMIPIYASWARGSRLTPTCARC